LFDGGKRMGHGVLVRIGRLEGRSGFELFGLMADSYYRCERVGYQPARLGGWV
jgi:hypothetical protein